MPTLDRITIYPVKSLDGLDLEEAVLLPSGGLEHDRRWQLVDMEGCVVNAKRTAVCHAVRATYDLDAGFVDLAVDPMAVAVAAIPGIERLAGLRPASFPLVPGPDGPCGWLAEVFEMDVLLIERRDGGFPDDREAPGPTVISTATLLEVARWFGFDLAESRRRFRANLELGGCDAFWEDSLASPARPELQPSFGDLPADPYADLPPPEGRDFSLGEARLRATKVCRRCVVPSRDSRTGAVTAHFRDAFEARRSRGLPAEVDASAWNHCYRLGINTRAAAMKITLGTKAVLTLE